MLILLPKEKKKVKKESLTFANMCAYTYTHTCSQGQISSREKADGQKSTEWQIVEGNRQFSVGAQENTRDVTRVNRIEIMMDEAS